MTIGELPRGRGRMSDEFLDLGVDPLIRDSGENGIYSLTWCLTVLGDDCSIIVIPYIRLGFGKFQHYLRSVKFELKDVRPTQTGYIQVIQPRPTQ